MVIREDLGTIFLSEGIFDLLDDGFVRMEVKMAKAMNENEALSRHQEWREAGYPGAAEIPLAAAKGPISDCGHCEPGAKYPDASMTQRGGSVNNGTTRSGTAPTPKSPGPRTA